MISPPTSELLTPLPGALTGPGPAWEGTSCLDSISTDQKRFPIEEPVNERMCETHADRWNVRSQMCPILKEDSNHTGKAELNLKGSPYQKQNGTLKRYNSELMAPQQVLCAATQFV